jgi:hypothetical protein
MSQTFSASALRPLSSFVTQTYDAGKRLQASNPLSGFCNFAVKFNGSNILLTRRLNWTHK